MTDEKKMVRAILDPDKLPKLVAELGALAQDSGYAGTLIKECLDAGDLSGARELAILLESDAVPRFLRIVGGCCHPIDNLPPEVREELQEKMEELKAMKSEAQPAVTPIPMPSGPITYH